MGLKPKYTPEPRGWTQVQVAAYVGVSLSWFSENRHDLQQAGFPQPDQLTGKTDGDAVAAWMDIRSPLLAKLKETGPDFDLALQRARGMRSGTARA